MIRDIPAVAEARAVGDSTRCGEAVGVDDTSVVGDVSAAGSVGVNVAGAMPQNRWSRSPFVPESDGSVSNSKGPATVPSGQV